MDCARAKHGLSITVVHMQNKYIVAGNNDWLMVLLLTLYGCKLQLLPFGTTIPNAHS